MDHLRPRAILVLHARLSIDCISVAETAAEKVLSLLRRCACQWDGHRKSGDMDAALMRHVYNVARIAELCLDALVEAHDVFAKLTLTDRDEFRGQNPAFDKDHKGVLVRTLATARHNGQLRARYHSQLLPLVYDIDPQMFDASFSAFEQVADGFLSAASSPRRPTNAARRCRWLRPSVAGISSF